MLVKLAHALGLSTDELLGVRPLKKSKLKEDPEERRLWKTFQLVLDRRAVVRLVRSLVASKRVAA